MISRPCWAQWTGHTHSAAAATSLRNVRSPPSLPPNYLGPSHHSQGPCDPPGPRGFCCSAWISAHTAAMCTWQPPGWLQAVFSDSSGGTKDAAAPADARGAGWRGLVPGPGRAASLPTPRRRLTRHTPARTASSREREALHEAPSTLHRS